MGYDRGYSAGKWPAHVQYTPGAAPNAGYMTPRPGKLLSLSAVTGPIRRKAVSDPQAAMSEVVVIVGHSLVTMAGGNKIKTGSLK